MKKEKELENNTEDLEQEVKETEELEQEEIEKEEGEEKEENEVSNLESELSEAKDKYLRLYSEFENFRRRTSKEKIDLIGSASREVVTALLPILDDFERAIKAANDGKQDEGIGLIYNKLVKVLEGKGVKKMEIKQGDDFDPEFHEAISQIPAPKKKLEGKIIDVVEPGYYLNDKVIRFAKVVTGAKSQ